MDYRPPSFRRPQEFNVPQSLDGLFEQYQHGRDQANAERERKGLLLLNKEPDPRDVTPQAMSQAQQPAAADEHPLIGAIRSHIERRDSARGMATKQGQAALDKTLSETDENKAQAEKLRRTPEPGAGPRTVNIKGVDYIETTGANGTPHYQPIPAREPTQSENAARQYADSATQAHESLSGLESSGFNPSGLRNAAENIAPTALQSKEFQSLDQSRRQFINAILRRESGAAISASEYDNYTRQYFPVPGDSKEVKAQKSSARELKIRGLSSEGKRVESQLKPGAVKKVGRFEVTEG